MEEDWVHTEDDEDESSDYVGGENDDSASMVIDNEEEEEEEESESEREGQGDEDGENSQDSESEDEKATLAAQTRKKKRKWEEESLARPAKRVSLNPIILGGKSKKDRHQNLSVKSKQRLAAVPKVVTAPKSILKKAGATTARVSKGVSNKAATQLQTDISRKDGDNKNETYDFGKFF